MFHKNLARSALRSSVAVCAMLAAGAARAQEPSATDVETVTVLGQAIYVAPSAVPMDVTQPTSVVQKGFIQNNIIPQSSFDDIIKFEPSVFDQSPNGPGIGKSETLSIRGFQDGQYNVTFDGIPFGDSTDLHHTSSALFIAHDLGEAEIDRGPGGASTIGKATFGGTVGFRTKDVDSEFSLNPYATYGSFNTAAAGLELNSGQTGFGAGFFDYQRESTEGYLTYAGEHRQNYMGKWVYDIDDTTTLTLLGTYNREQQYTTSGVTLANILANGRNFMLNNNPNTQAYFGYQPSLYVSDFYYADLKKTFGDFTVHNKAYTDFFAHNYLEAKDGSDTNPADNSLTIYPTPANIYFYNPVAYASSQGKKTTDIPGKRVQAAFRSWGDTLDTSYDTDFGTFKAGVWFDSQHDQRYSATVDLSNNNALVPGKNGTPFSYLYHTLSQTWQPYAEFDWKILDKLTVTPGVKYNDFHRHVTGPINKSGVGAIDYTENYDALLPSVSGRYAIDESWNAYVQVAEGFLAPPVAVFQVTTPKTIKPEKTWNYQVGSTMQRDDFTVSLDAYYIDFSNYFASIIIPGSSNTEFVNGGGAVYRGVEAEGQYVLGQGWSVYANGSLNGAQYKNGGVHLAESPEYTASAGLLYDTKEGPYSSLIGKLIGPRWGLDGNAVNPTTQQLVAADQYRFGSVVTFDFAAGYRIKDVNPTMSELVFSVKVANILDNRQIDDLAGLQSATNLPAYWTVAGRSFFFNVSMNLN
jgi:iron complex outermembrane receptor protein